MRLTFSAQEGAGEPSLGLEWSGFYDSTLEKFSRRNKEVLSAIGDAEKDVITAANRALRDEIDRDLDADVIDQVSNDIAIQFDHLLSEGNEKS